MANNVKVGSYTGTGAAINIELGWVPDSVEIFNATDGDVSFNWFNGMGAGDVLQNTNHDTAQQSLVTSNGVDAYEPTDYTHKSGFTVGTSLSESGKTFRYRAFRNTDD